MTGAKNTCLCPYTYCVIDPIDLIWTPESRSEFTAFHKHTAGPVMTGHYLQSLEDEWPAVLVVMSNYSGRTCNTLAERLAYQAVLCKAAAQLAPEQKACHLPDHIREQLRNTQETDSQWHNSRCYVPPFLHPHHLRLCQSHKYC